MDIHLNLSLTQDELRDPRPSLGAFHDVVTIDTQEVRASVPEASVEVAPGSVDEGAANWGADVIVTLTNIATIDGLIDLAQRLVRLAKKLTDNGSERQGLVSDPTTAGVLAVSSYLLSSELTGGVILGSWWVTGGDPGIGFDARDIWITSVETSDHSVLLIVTSPSGQVLGSLSIPPRF